MADQDKQDQAPGPKMAPAPADRKPDAVMMSVAKVAHLDEARGHSVLQQQAVSLLGCKPDARGRPGVVFTKVDANWRFFRAKPKAGVEAETLNFPQGHLLQGQPRYDWFKVSDVLFQGYLRPEAIEHRDDVNEGAKTAALNPPIMVQVQDEDKDKES